MASAIFDEGIGGEIDQRANAAIDPPDDVLDSSMEGARQANANWRKVRSLLAAELGASLRTCRIPPDLKPRAPLPIVSRPISGAQFVRKVRRGLATFAASLVTPRTGAFFLPHLWLVWGGGRREGNNRGR